MSVTCIRVYPVEQSAPDNALRAECLSLRPFDTNCGKVGSERTSKYSGNITMYPVGHRSFEPQRIAPCARRIRLSVLTEGLCVQSVRRIGLFFLLRPFLGRHDVRNDA